MFCFGVLSGFNFNMATMNTTMTAKKGNKRQSL